MRKLPCIVTAKTLCCPGVGRFWTRAGCQSGSLGVLERLHERFDLTVPPNLHYRVIVANGASLMVGDVMAEICEISTSTPKTTAFAHAICAPADGYISFCDASGAPLKSAGDILHHGDIVAFLEFMKIRMEIVYSGEEDAIFGHYCGPDRRAVQCGEIIAEY